MEIKFLINGEINNGIYRKFTVFMLRWFWLGKNVISVVDLVKSTVNVATRFFFLAFHRKRLPQC